MTTGLRDTGITKSGRKPPKKKKKGKINRIFSSDVKDKQRKVMDFPSGTVVKNPCANAKDIGSIPGTGGFCMLWGN